MIQADGLIRVGNMVDEVLIEDTRSVSILQRIGVPPDADYSRISASESGFNLDMNIIFHIRQYSYSYPYPKVRYGYSKNAILSVSDPISEGWVLDNDIRVEETILQ